MKVPLEEDKGVSTSPPPPIILGFRNFRATGRGPSPKHESMRAVLHYAYLCVALWSATSGSSSKCVRCRFSLFCAIAEWILEITVACVILPTWCVCVPVDASMSKVILFRCSHVPVVWHPCEALVSMCIVHGEWLFRVWDFVGRCWKWEGCYRDLILGRVKPPKFRIWPGSSRWTTA